MAAMQTKARNLPPTTLVEAFLLRAEQNEDEQLVNYPIIYFEDGKESIETVGDIYRASLRYLGAFQAAGLRQGDYVLLQIPSRRKHFRVFWACALGGIIPVTVAVPVDFQKNSSLVEKINGIIKTLVEVRQCLVLTEDSTLQPLSAALERHARVESVDVLRKKVDLDGKEAHVEPADVLFLQLTSGSTGIPKCIQETHVGIITQIVESAKVCGYTYGKTSLNWLPFDHVVPMLTTHLRDIFLGMGQVQIPTYEVISDPLLWLTALEKYKVNFSWSPNFGYNLVNQACKREGKMKQWNLQSLDFLLNAGEQVTRSVCESFIENTGIPSNVMQPSFGMAESCTCITYCNDYSIKSCFRALKSDSASSPLEEAAPDEPCIEFMDLGPVIGNVEIRIAAMNNHTTPAPEGTIGHFQIKGPVVTPGYVNRPEANKEAFVGDGWFDSGDLGFMRNGRLYLTGRHKESICVRGSNLFCYEIESQAERVAGVLPTFVAATSVPNESTGTEDLLIFFSPDKTIINDSCLRTETVDSSMRDLVSAVKKKVAEATGVSPRVVIPVLQDDFHKTTSGKIQRIKFRNLYREGFFQKLLNSLVNLPPLLQSECFEQTLSKKKISVGSQTLIVDVVSSNQDSPTTVAICNAIKEAGHCCSNKDSDTILFLGALDSYPTEDAVEACSQSIKVISQTVATLKNTNNAARFWAVTSTATEKDKLVGSAVHGFMRSLASEQPGRKPTIIAWDSDKTSLPSMVQALSSLDMEAEREVYVQSKGIFLPRLQPKRFASQGALMIRSKASYLITGGSGALAMELVPFLWKAGASHIALMSRSPESCSMKRALDPLRQQGLWVEVIVGNVSIDTDVERAVKTLSETPWPPLIGIFHLAGAYGHWSAVESSPQKIGSIFDCKARGAALLHEKSLHLDLDHFVLFSSVSGAIGPSGYSCYGAANVFLDELALMRIEKGLSALSVQFGPWDHEEGMAGTTEFPFFKKKIPLDEGLVSLGMLMQAKSQPGLVLAPLDFSVYKSAVVMDSSFFVPRLLVDLVDETAASGSIGSFDKSTLAKMFSDVAKEIIGTCPPLDVSLMSAGMDSAGAMQFLGRISKKLGTRLPPLFVFQHPTLQSMMEYFTSPEISSPTPRSIVHDIKYEPQIEFRRWYGSLDVLDKPLYLLGSGGHARTVIVTLKALGVPIAGIFSNRETDVGKQVLGVEVCGLLDSVPGSTDCFLHICLGNPGLKQEWAARFPRHSYVSIVHPQAIVDPSCVVGQGSFVGALAVIDGLVTVGEHSIIEVHSLVGHDTKIGSFTLVGGMAAIAGASTIGDGVVLGTHSSTAPKVFLGNRSVLGSGSSAHKDIAEDCTAVGVPAEVIYVGVPIDM